MISPSTALQSRAWVEVDLGSLAHNALQIQRVVGPAVGLVPMVKADAYGLGMAEVVPLLRRTFAPTGPRAFGVATVAEGEALRKTGWPGDVLVFSPCPPGEVQRAAVAGLTLCLSDVDAVRGWAEAAEQVGRRLAFHTEIDTGMGRSGFPWHDAARWGPRVEETAAGRLDWAGCFTHFHSADEPDLAATDLQEERFRAALAGLPPQPERTPPRVVHTSNSAAALRRPRWGDLVRPGIFLYGGSAGAALEPQPVVAVRARITLVREVAPGTTLGYGATYAATRGERWGTLAIGYGDGLPRKLGPAGGNALVRGRRVPIIGRISMDVTTIDLTDVPEAKIGDAATLIGSDGDAAISLDEVASQCGTISYEILTGLTPRLPRAYQFRSRD